MLVNGQLPTVRCYLIEKKKFLEWWFHFHLSQTASAIGTFPDYAAEKKRPQLFFGHRLWKVFSSGFDSSSCIFFSLQHSYRGSYFLPFSNFTFSFFSSKFNDLKKTFLIASLDTCDRMSLHNLGQNCAWGRNHIFSMYSILVI